MSTDHPYRAGAAATPASPPPTLPRAAGAARSLAFFTTFFAYLMLGIGIGQRVAVLPLLALFPQRRDAIVRRWLRAQARATLALASTVGGLRYRVGGSIPAEPVVVLMNHQSVLDIPLGIYMVPGPYPIIPTRARYRKGIPGISPLARLARYPFVTQRRPAPRSELIAIGRAADEVAAGHASMLIFPEGHRSRDGEIAEFMRSGLKLVLTRARRPVYCIVADGMWRVRTMADVAFRFSGTRVDATVLGPYEAPADPGALDAFIDGLRGDMAAALHRLRGGAEPPAALEPD